MTSVRPTVVPFIVDATGTGVAQHLVVDADVDHKFEADTYPAFGGSDSAPSPLVYALGALTSCNQITANLVAKERGITLGAFTFRAQGDLNPAVLVGGAEGNANFDTVTVEATVETDAEGADFDQLVAEVERRCPISQLFKRSGTGYLTTWERRDLP